MTHSSSAQSTWAIICGALRNPYEFYPALSYLLEMRNEGIIDEIVLSTWINEIDKHKKLRDRLTQLGIGIVESRDAKEGGANNLWRQFRSLDQGMRLCPPSCNIFKVRTDKISGFLKKFKKPIQDFKKQNQAPSLENRFKVFSSPLIVPFYGLSYPFMVKDIAFFGDRKTLEALCHFEYWTHISNSSAVWPEARWMAYPFFHSYPIFKEISQQYDLQLFSTYLVERSPSEPLPEIIIKMLALYLKLTRTNFTTCYLPEASVADASIEMLISGKDVEGAAIAEHGWKYSFLMHDPILDAALARDTPLARQLKEYYQNPEEFASWTYLTERDQYVLSKVFSEKFPKKFFALGAFNQYQPPAPSSHTVTDWVKEFSYADLFEGELHPEERRIIENSFDECVDFIAPIKDILLSHIASGNIPRLKMWIPLALKFPEGREWMPMVVAIGRSLAAVFDASIDEETLQEALSPRASVSSLSFAQLIIAAIVKRSKDSLQEVAHYFLQFNDTDKFRSWFFVAIMQQVIEHKMNLSNQEEIIEALIANPPNHHTLCICASWLIGQNQFDRGIDLLNLILEESKDEELRLKVNDSLQQLTQALTQN